MGDPAGIGPELTLRAAKDWGYERLLLFAAPEPYEALGVACHRTQPGGVLRDDALNLVPLPLAAPVIPGEANPANGKAVIESISQAVAAVQAKHCRAVVTNPIAKAVLYDSGFAFPGHTEFLGHLAGLQQAPIMMLASRDFRVVPVTLHVSLQEAIRQISEEQIIQSACETHKALQDWWGIEQPRLAVSGLNPHAGESGAMGREEIEIIAPALEQLRREGLNVAGPLPADTMFHARARERYDAALCMTHDQALIPIKTIAFDSAVNLTLGLPFVRTSPDHGTAFDIAGKGIARADSLMAAVRLADQLANAHG